MMMTSRKICLRLWPWLMFSIMALLTIVFIPSRFRHEAALQIHASHQGGSLPDGFYVYQHLNAQGIQIKSITPAHDSLVIRFESQEQSLAAQKVLRDILPDGFVIAQMRSRSGNLWLNEISFRPQSVG